MTRSLKNVKIWNTDGEHFTIEQSGNISGVKMNHKGSAILTWNFDNSLMLSDHQGHTIQTFKGLKSNVIGAEFSTNDQFILSTSQDGSFMLWDINGNIITQWDNHTDYPIPACFTSDGKGIITVEDNNTKIKICPLPIDVYKKMTSKIDQLSGEIEKIEQKYQLQFLGEITTDLSN